MRLSKNFVILQKSKVESQIVSTVENRPKIIRIFPVQNFGKMYRNIWKLTVSVKNRQLFSKFSTFDGICQKSRLFLRISTFSGIFRYKMALKMVENYGILYRKFRPSTVDFRSFGKCQKCTELFVFRLSTFPV